MPKFQVGVIARWCADFCFAPSSHRVGISSDHRDGEAKILQTICKLQNGRAPAEWKTSDVSVG
jgi:hypothetical protein